MASVADYDVRAAFSAIEEELIASMMRNLANHRAQETAEGIQWSQWQVEQLAALERYKKRNRKRFGGLFSGINARIERAIAVQRAAGQAGQELSILQAAKTGAKIDRAAKQAALEGSFHDINDRKFNALLRATTQDMEKAEHAILRRANDAYRKVIFNAQVYANTGAGTYEKAVDMATRDFLRSGIQCVVYKDGSRHSLADYADMALRTASKRAYLQGEGEQRQAWGISTVIVNKRGGACPKCARFCGKVFIDDVWSGGKAEDGDYPLLSSAIQMGLYHPRCKDAHSTFFPGVTEVDQPWTPAELEQLERTEQRQQRQQHAQRQAERYDRLARYSLDEENRERYRAREQIWSEQLDKLSFAENVSDGEAKRVEDEFQLMPERHRKMIENAGLTILVEDIGSSYFNRNRKCIVLAPDRPQGAFIHECAHAIDAIMGIYRDPKFDDVRKNGIDLADLASIVYDEDTFTKPAYFLKNKKFISEYQGRMYEHIGIYDGTRIVDESLMDYFPEGYREYLMNPENLKAHDPKLFDYIEELVNG